MPREVRADSGALVFQADVRREFRADALAPEAGGHFELDATSPLRRQHGQCQARIVRGAVMMAPLGREKVGAVIIALKSIVWSRSGLMSHVMEAIGD